MDNIILFGYAPLVRLSPEDFQPTQENIKRISRMYDNTQNSASYCIWINRDGIRPIMVINKAREIYNHLVEWTENNPKQWFKVDLAIIGDEYALAIVPDPKKSIERHKLRYKLQHMKDLKETNFTLLYKPLYIWVPKSGTIRRISRDIPRSFNVGLIDPKDISSPFSVKDLDNVMWLENLERGNNQYARQLLKDNNYIGDTN